MSNPFLTEHSLNSPSASALSAGRGCRKGMTEDDTTKENDCYTHKDVANNKAFKEAVNQISPCVLT